MAKKYCHGSATVVVLLFLIGRLLVCNLGLAVHGSEGTRYPGGDCSSLVRVGRFVTWVMIQWAVTVVVCSFDWGFATG